MDDPNTLTPVEREAQRAMLSALIDEAKRHGIDLMGIDHPAVAVRAAVGQWLIAARGFKRIPTAN
ncbi:hypothetical protein RQP54_17790 [Curvibacter sp. APW13]|uniref:hypothetical protein n=1 Tax=Curvibacter sp. APW13 TaxID=3077236 RepID=UPI0028DE920C|nr:hypothetical protein [Curvibacter sp. APW13]MDT8992729.1 hypothetical protein [Curvibacter sp. APW13]